LIWNVFESDAFAMKDRLGPPLPWNALLQIEIVAPDRTLEMSPNMQAVLSQFPPATLAPRAATTFQVTSLPQSSLMFGVKL
jgi:hypothetical protein